MKKIIAATKDYSQFEISDIERELLNNVGSRAGVDPAIVVQLGDGTGGIIYEDADGNIIMNNLDTNKVTYDAQNIIDEVVSSWK